MTGDRGRRTSYQKRSEAKVGMRSSGIAPILKKIVGPGLRGRPEDESGDWDDISDVWGAEGQQGGNVASQEGRRAVR